MKGILRRLTSRDRAPALALALRTPATDEFAVMIARRAQRVSNRSRSAAQRFEAVHMALKASTTKR